MHASYLLPTYTDQCISPTVHHGVLLNKAQELLQDGFFMSSRNTYVAGQGEDISTSANQQGSLQFLQQQNTHWFYLQLTWLPLTFLTPPSKSTYQLYDICMSPGACITSLTAAYPTASAHYEGYQGTLSIHPHTQGEWKMRTHSFCQKHGIPDFKINHHHMWKVYCSK